MMLDSLSLDQLRAFSAAADQGSFSAAGRKLSRVQSAISSWIGVLEARLGVELFDRSGRRPRLTPEGRLLLADAHEVLAAVDRLKARARLMAEGVESELSVVVDVFFPTQRVIEVVRAFANRFPLTPLRLSVEGLGAGYQRLREGRSSLGILVPPQRPEPSLVAERIDGIQLVMVAARSHPLSAIDGRISPRELARHLQLVLTDRSDADRGPDQGVLSPTTWRLTDLSTKHAFLRDAVGWGGMPLHMVEDDIAAGTLCMLDIDDIPRTGFPLAVSAVHPADMPPGPAGRWFIDYLKASVAAAGVALT